MKQPLVVLQCFLCNSIGSLSVAIDDTCAMRSSNKQFYTFVRMLFASSEWQYACPGNIGICLIVCISITLSSETAATANPAAVINKQQWLFTWDQNGLKHGGMFGLVLPLPVLFQSMNTKFALSSRLEAASEGRIF